MNDNAAKITRPQISLIPLTREHHADALQQVYSGADDYWAMYAQTGAPHGQAALDLRAAAETPGRTMIGIVQPSCNEARGIEMIGVVDFRLHWPDERMAHIGIVMVAAPYRRQGVGSQAWHLLAPWLADNADVKTVRCGLEQFNLGALKFFQNLGFKLSGETTRIRIGDMLVRLLYMEMEL